MILIYSLFHCIQLWHDKFHLLVTNLIGYSWTIITFLKRAIFTSTFDFITQSHLDVLQDVKRGKKIEEPHKITAGFRNQNHNDEPKYEHSPLIIISQIYSLKF